MKTSMHLSRLVLAAALMVIAAGVAAYAQDVVIIANAGLKANSISREELRNVFLLRTRMLNGSAVEPVLEKSGPVHAGFLKRFLDRDSAEIHTYYQGLVFTGRASMPKQLNSDAEVIEYVAQTRGAIGYVGSAANVDSVKILTIGSQETGKQRTLLTRVEPEYPETLLRLGIGGTVRMELTIGPKGGVEDVLVLGGNPILAESAATAAKRWVFAAWPSTTKQQVTIPFNPQH